MKIKSVLMIVLGTLICALSFNIFMVPHNILPGGVSGIALIVNKFFDIDNSLFILIASVILLLISLIFLGKKETTKSVLGSLMFPFFVYLTEFIVNRYHLFVSNVLLSSIFAGITFGFGLGLVYKVGYTTGGTDIIKRILNKYAYVGMGTGMIIVDGIVLLIASYVFGIDILMYSLIIVYLSGLMIDRVILGISNSKSFYIITNEPKKVSDYIIKELKHGVTILDGKGAYSNDEKGVILTVIPTHDYYKLKEGLKLIDSKAFFVVCDSYEVGGGV